VRLTGRARAVSVSTHGRVVFCPEVLPTSRPTWRWNGRRIGTIGKPAEYHQLVLSARGRHATLVRRDDQSMSISGAWIFRRPRARSAQLGRVRPRSSDQPMHDGPFRAHLISGLFRALRRVSVIQWLYNQRPR
jgi:hypothetical protein